MIIITWRGEGGADEVGAEAHHEGGQEGGQQLVRDGGGGLATGRFTATKNNNILLWHIVNT